MNTNHYVPPNNFMDLLLDVVCVVDRDSYFLYVSAASERVFGYKPEEMVGRPVIEFVHPDDRKKTINTITEILYGVEKTHFENRYIRKDGKVVHIMWSARWYESDQVRIAVARDITEKKRAESKQKAVYAISEAANEPGDLPALLKRIHEVIKELLPADNFAVALCDPESGELSFPYYADQYNTIPVQQMPDADTVTSQVITSGSAILMTPDTIESVNSHSDTVLIKNAHNWLGVPLKSAEGITGALVVYSYWDEEVYSDKDRELLEFVSDQVAAAVELRKAFTRLEYMAQYDQLTGLPNRALFLDRLKTSLSKARRNRSRLGVLYLDLDEFKQVNDRFGHSTGDKVLSEVARRLLGCVRESDTVARLGGDEFAVLLNDIENPGDILVVTEKIRLSLESLYRLDDLTFRLSSSIGAAVYPENGTDDESLIHFADKAMYKDKKT